MTNRVYLVIEFFLFFIGVPIVFYYDLVPVPKLAALLAVTLLFVFILWYDRDYDLRNIANRPTGTACKKRLLLKGTVVAIALFGLVWFVRPTALFAFPRENTVVWAAVMLLYPLLSVLPQEFIYREFFFHRYKILFGRTWGMILASALAFSFLHVIYANGWAIGLSFAGGILFSKTYYDTRSLLWTSLEHALYGALVFTIGMGAYFYEPF